MNIPRRPHTAFPAYCAALCAAFLIMALAAQAATIDLGTFENPNHGWTYQAGEQATGSLKVDGGQAHGGRSSLRLSGDFSHGGDFVGVHRRLLSSATALRFWVRAQGVDAMEVWLTDFSGQTFVHRLDLKPGTEWQFVTLDPLAPGQSFQGGPADGVWHGPLKEIALRLEKNSLAPGVTQGSLWFDDITVEEDPPGPPIATEQVTLSGDTIFGFSNHMIHTDLFYGRDKMGPYSRLEYTLPWVINGHFGLMREPLYQGFFAGEKRDEETKAANRAIVERYLDAYGRAGVRVLLCPMFTRVGREGFDDFFRWLGTLPARYPAVAGFEMHNEPHLKSFGGWKGPEYAEAVKQAAKLLHEQAPHTPIVIGSMSHLWWPPAVQFLQDALQHGALTVADGISVHPYRKDQAPEGGAGHCAKDDPCGLEKEMLDFWALVQRHNPSGKPLQLYLTEFGYSSGTGKGSLAPEQSTGIGNEERQADYLTRMMLVLFDLRLRGLPLQGLYWYDLKVDRKASQDMEGNFGLISYEAAESRTGYTSYARLATAFEHTADWWALDTPATFSTNPEVMKSFTWQRLSDGALVVPFWRMNQLQKDDADFETTLTVPLPPGFEAARVLLHDPREKQPSEVESTAAQGSVSLTVKARDYACWLEILPRSPVAIKGSGPWPHALPAEFPLPQGGRLRLTAPHEAEPGKEPRLEISLDNHTQAEAFTGTLQLPGRQIPLNAKPHETATLAVPLTTGTEAERLLLTPYLLESNGALIGRGDFPIMLPAPSQPAPKP